MSKFAGSLAAGTFASIVYVIGVYAQTVAPPQNAGRTFEAASVKRNYLPKLIQRPRVRMEAHRFTAVNATLRQLIRAAYDTSVDAQIIGGPEWMDSIEFDVTATAPGAARQDVRLMLRRLLVDRFSMTARQEIRTLPVLRLLRTDPTRRLAPGLTPSACDPAQPGDEGSGCNTVGYGSGSLVTSGVTMPRLAALLPRLPVTDIDRFVVDQTGLMDAYAFHLRFSPSGQLPGLRLFEPDADLPSFPTALREQLGLKLEPGQAPVSVLVIDRADLPTAD